MANTIQVHRTSTAVPPTGLLAGEMAWVDQGGHGRLFIRDAANTDDIIIGGPQMIKEPVYTVSTANINLASAVDPNPVNGYTLIAGQRVLLNAQSTASQNGIYEAVTATDPTTWIRSDDFDNASMVKEGMIVPVKRGSDANTVWFLTTADDAIVVGTDALSFSNITGSGDTITGGDGILNTSGTLSVDLGTDSGLAIEETDKLEVKIDANGGLQKATAGIGFDSGVDGAGLTNTNGVLAVDALNTLPAPAGDLSLASNKITSLTDPTAAQDAATKAYVDLHASGLDAKGSVQLVEVSTNRDLTGEETIDGVLTSTSRVLLTAQTATEANGIYVTAAGAWSRSVDANVSAEVTAGMFCWVTEGTTYADTGWVLTTNDPIVLDTTGLTFTQFSGVGQLNAGDGINITAPNTIVVDLDASGGLEFNAGAIRLEAAVAGDGLAHSSGVLSVNVNSTSFALTGDEIVLAAGVAGTGLTLTTNVINLDTVVETLGGTGQTTYTQGDVLYSDAANSLAKLAKGTTGQFLRQTATIPEWSDVIDGGTYT